MADIKIRKLPDWVVSSFKARAVQHGRSLEEELRILLTDEAAHKKRDVADEIVALNQRLREKYGELSDSTQGIREDRERG